MSERIKLMVRVSCGICKNCGAKRNAYYLNNYCYGERLILTSDGKHYAYINLIQDKVFDEVDTIMQSVLAEFNIFLSPRKNSDNLNLIFGMACDEIEGISIDASNTTKCCLQCGSDHIVFSPDTLDSFTETEFPIVSHIKWKKYNDIEKRQLIRMELHNIGINIPG